MEKQKRSEKRNDVWELPFKVGASVRQKVLNVQEKFHDCPRENTDCKLGV